MKNINNCPVCANSHYSTYITCKDHTVSQLDFSIVSCQNCEFKFTNPRPEDDQLGDYYKSEDYISHSDTSRGMVAKLYKLVRNYTLRKKLELVSRYVSRGTILDYGCGTGMFLDHCRNSSWETFGMEPDAGAAKIASGMQLNVYPNKESLSLALENRTLDAISLWHVLEHVTDLGDTLTFFKERLSPNGVLIIAVPNYRSADATKYKQYWAAYDVPRHLYHFDIKTISRLLKDYGFTLSETHPMKFDSYYVSMLSEKYKTGRVRYFRAFISGLISNMKARSTGDYSSRIYVFKKA
jgi:2-polyprenyl-3-methyl-5-hydroxy-6-metoxy-1,4-benzoquinol methylase